MRRARFVAVAVVSLAALTAAPVAAAPVSQHDGVMPNLVGQTVWDADNTVPLGTRLLLVDGTGQHRKVVWPSNWQVCKQDPAAGTPLTSATAVTLTVVRLEEKC
jgi:beta-lactam-binding protein with PASTA domain